MSLPLVVSDIYLMRYYLLSLSSTTCSDFVYYINNSHRLYFSEKWLALCVFITISLFKFIKQLIYLSIFISITTISTDISQYYNNEFIVSST